MEYYLPQTKALGEHQFAVIDKVFASELMEHYPTLDIVSAHLKPQSHLYPALISLHELPSPDWQALLATITQSSSEASTPKVCLLLESPLSAGSLRNELANALLINDEKQRNYLLRYYDPRVLFQLSWMLTPWQLQMSLKTQMIPSWTYLLENQWHTLHFPNQINYQKNDPIDLPLAQINRIGLINLTLNKLPTIISLAERIVTSQRIDELLLQANKCGLIEKEDVVAFALQGVAHPCAFWLHHDVQAVLKAATQHSGYYRRITSGWDLHRWEEITSQSPTLTFSKGI